MPALVRQEVGHFILFAHTIGRYFDRALSRRARYTVFLIGTVALVLSHYSTSYIWLTLMFGGLLLSYLIRFFINRSGVKSRSFAVDDISTWSFSCMGKGDNAHRSAFIHVAKTGTNVPTTLTPTPAAPTSAPPIPEQVTSAPATTSAEQPLNTSTARPNMLLRDSKIPSPLFFLLMRTQTRRKMSASSCRRL